MKLSKASFVAPYATIGHHFSLLESPLTRVSDSIGKQSSILVARSPDSTMFTLLTKLSDVRTVPLNSIKVICS